MAYGIGLTLGPILSAYIYHLVGYSGTFISFGCFIFVMGLLTLFCCLPKRLDNKAKEDETTLLDSERSPVTWRLFFTNKRSVTSIILCFTSVIYMRFFDPILTVHLTEMGQSEFMASLGFSINTCSVSIAAIFVGSLCKKWSRKRVFLLSSAVCAVGLFVMAPCSILGLPNKAWLTFLGLGIVGVGIAGLTIPVMPECIEAVSVEEFGIVEADEGESIEEEDPDPTEAAIADKASALYNMAYIGAGAVAPVAGGTIADQIGFE